jgi:3'-phosphoadenosine 5'-phosphosulfate sulfotransferase (PAPS reductase)/FAD synthetase
VSELDEMIQASRQMLFDLLDEIKDSGRETVGVVSLFSGGNDSSVLTHMFRDVATHAGHCNTGIGIEPTRQFVRDRCVDWDLPLLEIRPDEKDSYRTLVIDQGFPGPAHHYKMYQRLKERQLRKMRRMLITNGRKQRVVFLAGRRRQESARRANVPERDTDGAIEWLSPLVEWSNDLMDEYRSHFQLPRNEVSDMLHMSGECLCGAFAKPNEIEEIAFFFPEVAEEIVALEVEVRAAGHEEKRCTWGWGGWDKSGQEVPSSSGPLCSSCDARFDETVTSVIVGGGA